METDKMFEEVRELHMKVGELRNELYHIQRTIDELKENLEKKLNWMEDKIEEIERDLNEVREFLENEFDF